MHIVTRPRPEILTVKFGDKYFEVNMNDGDAYVPEDLGQFMISKGLVAKGYRDDPKPSWVLNVDGSHGDLIPRYAHWVKEIPDLEKTK
jgi:hypothetical protein